MNRRAKSTLKHEIVSLVLEIKETIDQLRLSSILVGTQWQEEHDDPGEVKGASSGIVRKMQFGLEPFKKGQLNQLKTDKK